VKELNSHAQVLFVLFSDSVDITAKRKVKVRMPHSIEDAVYSVEELPESDQDIRQNALRLVSRK
jgi:hypothetical protein